MKNKDYYSQNDLNRVVLLLLVLSAPASLGRESYADETPSPAGIMAEYRRADDELGTHFANMQGSARRETRIFSKDARSTVEFTDFQFARTVTSGRSVITHGRADEPTTVAAGDPIADGSEQDRSGRSGVEALCFNETYAVRLRKSLGSDAYAVQYFGDDIASVRRSVDGRLNTVWNCMRVTSFLSVAKLSEDPRFVVGRIVELPPSAGRTLRRIEFVMKAPPADQPLKRSAIPIVSGNIVVDSSHHWSVHDGRVRIQIPDGRMRVMTSHVEYQDDGADYSMPKTVRLRTLFYDPAQPDPPEGDDSKGQLAGESTLTFDRFLVGPVPESEFTAAAFGVPEIAEPGKQRYANRTGTWLIALAVVAFVGAIGLRYWAARRKTD